jgi:hypothetical protein
MKIISKKFLIALSLLFISYSQVNPCDKFKEYSFPPKDESSKDASFLKFKEKLVKAIKSKDAEFIKGIVDKNIIFSFGAESGKKAFIENWKLNSTPDKSEFWDVMDQIVRLGFAYNENKQFVAPYIFENFPTDLTESYSLINGTNVNIRNIPSKSGKVITKLSYNIVFVDNSLEENSVEDKSNDCRWQKICTSNGIEGFVCDKFLHSSMGYRAIFEKKKDKWMLNIFLAGD